MPNERHVAEVVKRSHERSDGLMDRALAIIQKTLDPFGHLEDQFEEPEAAEDDRHHVRPGDPL